MKKRLVYISNIATPYQIKLCYALQNYFDSEFWFHEHVFKDRPEWWKIDLGPKCKILKYVLKRNGRYISLDIIGELRRFAPDIVMLIGFTLPSNYIAYRWAKKNNKKTIIFTESFRRRGRFQERKTLKSRLLENIYKNVNAVFTCHEDATDQLKLLFDKLGQKVLTAQYPSDIDEYFKHPLREEKSAYTYLFPNRLIDIYNPLLAIDIFSEVNRRYPNSKLLMNTMGELFDQCKLRTESLGLTENVVFLNQIKSWDELHLVYKESDILLFPANFSNGNFTIVEAMASGMGIVISNKILWNSKIINNGVNGYVCEVKKEDFLAAVQNYIANPKLLKNHAIINREKVKPLTIASTAKLFFNLISTNQHL